MQVIPRKGTTDTGFNATIKSQIVVFNTDLNKDSTNYESLVVRAGGANYTIRTGNAGTGSERPIEFGSSTTLFFKLDTVNDEVNMSNLTNYANDAAAGSAGLAQGDLYTTTAGSEITLKVKS